MQKQYFSKPIFLILIWMLMPIWVYSQSYTFSTNADFDRGTLVGLEHQTVADQLQLSKVPPLTFPFIWVPNSNEGTVSKVDTRTGAELGRYRTGPSGNGSPSRTTVDIEGNCWVGNRQTGTVIKIGLYEHGQYEDRNKNGIIETSKDSNGDGNISGAELLPWGQDECVLYEVVLIPGKEGTFIPGQYPGPYANDTGNPGPRGFAIDKANNLWAGTFGSRKFYYVQGDDGKILKTIDVSSVNHTSYGALIDGNGMLWSSGQEKNHVLRLDPVTNTFTTIGVDHFVYGMGIDKYNHLFISGWQNSKLTRINVLTNKVEWTVNGYYQSRGVAITNDGDVWVANSGPGTVTRWSNGGVVKAEISVGNQPTGVAVDADDKVWVVNYGDEYIKRIDPATNKVDLEKRIIGGTHYGYSDMTGIIVRAVTTRTGTWQVVHDTGSPNSPWGVVSWTGVEPGGTFIKTRVRSSDNQQEWSTWEVAANGGTLNATPAGRYLQVEVTMQGIVADVSPILYDLTVAPATGALCGYFFPNPYNPALGTGYFALCQAGDATIEIYNASNWQIKTISVAEADGVKIPWNGTDENAETVANGVYFYVIKPASGTRNSGKIAITR